VQSLLHKLRLRLLDPPPATPEAEAAATLLYLGLPAKAILGRVEGPGDRNGWVWWVWGRYPSKRALIPANAASRLEELRETLRERHRSELSLVRSVQIQAAKFKPLRWRTVRDVWDAYLGRGSLARVLELKRQLESL